jgi:hypothetical protein
MFTSHDVSQAMTPLTIAIAGLLGLFGAGFAGYKMQQQVPSPDAITLDRTPETPAQEPTRPATGLVNSSDRRTEDFGSGPSGKVVADGIGDRHRQAFGDAVPGIIADYLGGTQAAIVKQ